MSYEYDEVKHHGRRFNHRKNEEEAMDTAFSETTEVSEVIVATEPQVDHKKEEKHHKHLELLAGLGAAAAGAYALHENSEAKKDLEHGHNHKTKEEIGAVAAVAAGGFAFHEHHEKNEAKEADEEAYGKRHHQRLFG